jgi:glycine betaine/proline transport system ATP-binding protein
LSSSDRDFAYAIDAQRRFLGIVSSEGIQQALEKGAKDTPISQAFIKDVHPVQLDDSMQDILPEVASWSFPVPVVDENNVYKGVVSKNRFLRTLHRTEQDRAEEAEALEARQGN